MASTVASVISPKLLSFLPFILLGGALMAGVIVAYRLYRETHEEEDTVSTDELLAEFEEAHDSGALDDAEYHRVIALLRNPNGPKLVVSPRPDNPTPVPRTDVAPPDSVEDPSALD